MIQPKESEGQEQGHEEDHRFDKAGNQLTGVLVIIELREDSYDRSVSEYRGPCRPPASGLLKSVALSIHTRMAMVMVPSRMPLGRRNSWGRVLYAVT